GASQSDHPKVVVIAPRDEARRFAKATSSNPNEGTLQPFRAPVSTPAPRPSLRNKRWSPAFRRNKRPQASEVAKSAILKVVVIAPRDEARRFAKATSSNPNEGTLQPFRAPVSTPAPRPSLRSKRWSPAFRRNKRPQASEVAKTAILKVVVIAPRDEAQRSAET